MTHIINDWTIADWDFFTEETHKISVLIHCNGSGLISINSSDVFFYDLHRCVKFSNKDWCVFDMEKGNTMIIHIELERLHGGG